MPNNPSHPRPQTFAEWYNTSQRETTRVAVAAALERAAEMVRGLSYPYPVLTAKGMQEDIGQRIENMIPADSRDSLEAHDREAYNKAIKATLNFPDSGGLYHSVLANNPDSSPLVRAERLKEAEWWADRQHDMYSREKYERLSALRAASPHSISVTNSVPPLCPVHQEPMLLYVYDRPGSPPGNGWVCQSCFDAARAATPADPPKEKP